jgi:hypothetical protein
MTKASRNVALILIPLGLVFLGYRSCDEHDFDLATTRSSSGSGSHSHFYSSGRSASWSSGSSSSAHSSGTSRGGFGSHGGSMGS